METTFVLDALEQAFGPVVRPAPSITAIKALSMCPGLYGAIKRSKTAGINREYRDSYGSAMAESINGLYKAEVITVRAGKTVQKWNWPHSRGWMV